MRRAHLRLLCMGLIAVATGAGAGFAFLQTFPADAAAPVPAASPAPQPAAASWPLGARQPAPPREGTRAPGPIDSAPPPSPPPLGEQPKPATGGKKYAPPPRSKLAIHTPHIDAKALEETIADAGVPLRIRRWYPRW
jgi:hypothetical protein